MLGPGTNCVAAQEMGRHARFPHMPCRPPIRRQPRRLPPKASKYSSPIFLPWVDASLACPCACVTRFPRLSRSDFLTSQKLLRYFDETSVSAGVLIAQCRAGESVCWLRPRSAWTRERAVRALLIGSGAVAWKGRPAQLLSHRGHRRPRCSRAGANTVLARKAADNGGALPTATYPAPQMCELLMRVATGESGGRKYREVSTFGCVALTA